jgi:hypothetical protein
MARKREKKPGKDEAWAALAGRRGGEIVPGRKGGVKKVRFPIEPWVLTLDSFTQSTGESSHPVTRLRIPYRARDDFRFRIYRQSIFSAIGKMFGMQDIEVGRPEIDDDWIIRSNSVGRIQSVMALTEISRSLAALRTGGLDIKPLRGKHKAADRMVASYQVTGLLRDDARLDAAVTLMQSLIERLCRLGCAFREAVPVEL